MTGRPLYAFLPIAEAVPQLNEALREIADSLRALEDGASAVSAQGQPFIPAQAYNKFGYNPDIDTATLPEDVWLPGGTLVWPTAAASATVVSDNAADAAAGAGAQEIVLEGVDASFDFLSETIVPNGTTPVLSSAAFLFVHRAFVRAVGSNGTNVGEIDISIGGNLVNRIGAGLGQTQNSHIVVPNPTVPGQVPYLVEFNTNVGKNANAWAIFELLTQTPGEGRRTRGSYIVNGGGSADIELTAFERATPGTRVWTRVVDVSANNMAASAGIQIVYLTPPT